MDDAMIIAKLDRTFRSVVQIRGRLKIYDGRQELLTDALRRLAASGQIEVDYQNTTAPVGRRNSDGPAVFRIELYRLSAVAAIEVPNVALLPDLEANARVGATHGATNHDQN